MQLLGLPNETLEHDTVFGDILVSLAEHEGYNPIVTMIWETPFNLPDKKVLVTCLSIEYDSRIMPDRARHRWLFELLAQPRPFNGRHIRGETNEYLVAQAIAFDQINQIRKMQSHDTDAEPFAVSHRHGLEGEAVHRTP